MRWQGAGATRSVDMKLALGLLPAIWLSQSVLALRVLCQQRKREREIFVKEHLVSLSQCYLLDSSFMLQPCQEDKYNKQMSSRLVFTFLGISTNRPEDVPLIMVWADISNNLREWKQELLHKQHDDCLMSTGCSFWTSITHKMWIYPEFHPGLSDVDGIWMVCEPNAEPLWAGCVLQCSVELWGGNCGFVLILSHLLYSPCHCYPGFFSAAGSDWSGAWTACLVKGS